MMMHISKELIKVPTENISLSLSFTHGEARFVCVMFASADFQLYIFVFIFRLLRILRVVFGERDAEEVMLATGDLSNI